MEKFFKVQIDASLGVETAFNGAMGDGRKELIRHLGGELRGPTTTGTAGIQTATEKIKLSARGMREILAAVTKDWPPLLEATSQLKPHLHELIELLDSVLQG
jgi:ABC-type sugar transport system ATPase subunit